jgi:DNA-directed RNA polymerase subunit omega
LLGTNILIYSQLMARVTIEDCLKKIDNAYDIVSLASQRAKDLLDGSEPKIDYPGKPSVVALKEIAEGLIDMSYFDIRRKQKIEEQLSDAIAEEEAISDIAAESEELTENIDTELVSVSADTEGDTEAPVTDSIPEENTEDKPA